MDLVSFINYFVYFLGFNCKIHDFALIKEQDFTARIDFKTICLFFLKNCYSYLLYSFYLDHLHQDFTNLILATYHLYFHY